MSIVLKQVGIAQTSLKTQKPTVYSSDVSLIGQSFEIRSSSKEKKSFCEIEFTKMGLFDVEPLYSLRRNGENPDRLEIDRSLFHKEFVKNMLFLQNWGRHSFSNVIVFTKAVADYYELNGESTVALFSQPFVNAWSFKEAIDALRERNEFTHN